MPDTKITCETCGKRFTPTKAYQRFCSTPCRMKAAAEQRATDDR